MSKKIWTLFKKNSDKYKNDESSQNNKKPTKKERKDPLHDFYSFERDSSGTAAFVPSFSHF